MRIPSTTGSRYLSLLLLLTAAGCDQGLGPTGSPSPGTLLPQDQAKASLQLSRSEARRRLGEIAQISARALRDSAVRTSLALALSHSTHPEGKVILQSLLADSAGGFGALMAERAGIGLSVLTTLAGQSVPIELYFPVPAHRRAWRGGPDLLVAAQLADGDTITAYRLAGGRELLSAEVVPAVPTLVLVGAESLTLDGPKLANATFYCPDPNVDCDGGGGGGGTPPEYPPGLYVTSMYLEDLHEDWTRGSPEIEIDFIGPRQDTTRSEIYKPCSHEEAFGWRRFDMDDHYWSGHVLVADTAQLRLSARRLNPASPTTARWAISVWEDDTDRCKIVTDNTYTWDWYVANLGLVTLGTALATDPQQENWYPVFYAAALNSLTLLWDAIVGGYKDDFAGNAVQASAWEAATGGSVPTNQVIIKNGRMRGYLQLELIGPN